MSEKESSPVLATRNLVVPEALAAKISPLLSWLTINEALEPIPPETESGARVLAALPTKTPVSESEVKTKLPVPFGVRVKLSSEIVPIVAAEPAPRLREVVEIPSVAAVVIEARFAAVIDVAFGRARVELLIVAVAPEAPKFKVEAAPKALTVVAFVLKTSKLDEVVWTEVRKVGLLLNTAEPVPVSSVREAAKTEERAEVVTFELASRNKALEAVRADRLIVASDN